MGKILFNMKFEKVSLSSKVREIFSDALITSFVIHKKERVLEFGIDFQNKIIGEKYIADLKNQLLNQLPLEDVIITLRYSNIDIENDNILDIIRENVVVAVHDEGPICTKILSESKWTLNDNILKIEVKNATAFYLVRKNIDNLIENKLEEEYGIKTKVIFKDKKQYAEDTELFRKNQEIQEFEILKKIQEQSLSNTSFENKTTEKIGDNRPSNVLIGKEITGTVIRIKETKTEGEKVIIEGYIFNIDKREIKGEKYIISFDITDKTDSTTVKFFIDKKTLVANIDAHLKDGNYFKIKGEVQFDKYAKEINIISRDISLASAPSGKSDTAKEKRVELHLHTQMSRMDGMTSAKSYIDRALSWGHKAIAITDHGVVQAFPEAMESAMNKDIKIIYGVEGYLIDDLGNAVVFPKGQSLEDEFVVFDIETTGLSKERDKITEIGAVKIKNGKITDSFSTFVNPMEPISYEITKLTGITDEMVKDAPNINEVLPKFFDFFADSILVAHNANFDVGFIRKAASNAGLKHIKNTVIDTVELAKSLLPELSRYKLNFVCEAMDVQLKGHHRAVNDAQATAEVFVKFIEMLTDKDVFTVDDINVFCSRTINYNKLKSNHIIILAKDYTGLRNLYELISVSHLEYFFKRPRIPKSKLMQKREGLIIGSACEAGELYSALLDDKPKEIIDQIVRFYDYLEIQPIGNNKFMIESNKIDTVNSYDDIKSINKAIVNLGIEFNKPVVATCDTHFIDPEDEIYRRIIMSAEGFTDADNQAPLYFRTTDEMLEEFEYLGKEKAYEIVVTNTNLIAESVENIKPIPNDTFPPRIDGADDDLRRICIDKAYEIYGNPLPEIVKNRLERELNSIISNGYAVLYIIAQKLVWNSVENGYLVGSRGSVGSSFAATMAGITEVNPLSAHYICPNCKFSDFESENAENARIEGGSGCDMPDVNCPNCGILLNKEGHDIPFETFLGFEGDKEPDIDLNFSGEYQQKAHAYTEELFGKGKVFKAGTIGTMADKTAYGFVMKYLEQKERIIHNAEINRLINGCTGIKRTTGQHPGGLMVVPSDHDIHEFCPIQRPADDIKSDVITTHFDYHSISGRLLKLDLLGHDDPTIIRMLYDLTGINPQSVKLDDKETMSLFESPKALGVTKEQINCTTGTLGVPEFGTRFVRQMLIEAKPKNFSDLLRISGLSHGTDVWTNNASDLISNGVITLKETISTRDSIMSYLITKGLPNKPSFKIMEQVRKGNGLLEDEIALMKEYSVPDWYIESCQRIKYMFPKAHAAAYVMMAFRIAYFKVNYPMAYYCSYFTIRASDDFDYATMCLGEEIARKTIAEIAEKGNLATTKEKNKLTVLELVIEFYARGFIFHKIDLYRSDATKFILHENGLIPPFNSLQGLGITAAKSIVYGRDEKGEFNTIESFKERTGIGKSLIELLKENDVLKGIPETNQLTLF